MPIVTWPNGLVPPPTALSRNGTIRERGGQAFNSNAAQLVIDTVHDVLSFAAGRWAGRTLVTQCS